MRLNQFCERPPQGFAARTKLQRGRLGPEYALNILANQPLPPFRKWSRKCRVGTKN
jgi:hypothetical protein